MTDPFQKSPGADTPEDEQKQEAENTSTADIASAALDVALNVASSVGNGVIETTGTVCSTAVDVVGSIVGGALDGLG